MEACGCGQMVHVPPKPRGNVAAMVPWPGDEVILQREFERQRLLGVPVIPFLWHAPEREDRLDPRCVSFARLRAIEWLENVRYLLIAGAVPARELLGLAPASLFPTAQALVRMDSRDITVVIAPELRQAYSAHGLLRLSVSIFRDLVYGRAPDRARILDFLVRGGVP